MLLQTIILFLISNHSKRPQFKQLVYLHLDCLEVLSHIASRRPLPSIFLVGLSDEGIYFALQIRGEYLSCGFPPFWAFEVLFEFVYSSIFCLQNTFGFEYLGGVLLLYFLYVGSNQIFLLFKGVIQYGDYGLISKVELLCDPGSDFVAEPIYFFGDFGQSDGDFI